MFSGKFSRDRAKYLRYYAKVQKIAQLFCVITKHSHNYAKLKRYYNL